MRQRVVGAKAMRGFPTDDARCSPPATVYPERLISLTPAELGLLQVVRLSDEDHGGLRGGELTADEHEPMERLCSLGLVEAIGEYGEAPDGEEDEREAGASNVVYRVTARGVSVLADQT